MPCQKIEEKILDAITVDDAFLNLPITTSAKQSGILPFVSASNGLSQLAKMTDSWQRTRGGRFVRWVLRRFFGRQRVALVPDSCTGHQLQALTTKIVVLRQRQRQRQRQRFERASSQKQADCATMGKMV